MNRTLQLIFILSLTRLIGAQEVASHDLQFYLAPFNADGSLDKAAYAQIGRETGFDATERRLGPGFSFYNPGVTLPDPNDKKNRKLLIPAAKQRVKKFGKINGETVGYQIGAPKKDPGGYWATHGQVLYAPDGSDDPGIDRFEAAFLTHSVLNLKPSPARNVNSHPDDCTKRADWFAAVNGNLGQAVAIDRAYWSFSENGFMVFTSGLVGGGAITNVFTYPHFAFPPNKIPTGIALTNKNELALVTIWDTDTFSGQVAVLALGCTDKGRLAYALPSWGIIDRVKLLGYIDLPGMAAPTGISAASCNEYLFEPVLSTEYIIEDAATRAKYFNGNEISRCGYAVVISRAESKAVFIDLQPLLGAIRDQCFTTQENASVALNAGDAPDQWPFSFDNAPALKPVVIKTIDIPNPTAVRVSPFSRETDLNGTYPAYAAIASLDGTLSAFGVGALSTTAPASADDIQLVGTAQVGRNPCHIAHQRYGDPFRKQAQGTDVAGWYSIRFCFLVCSRGDRSITWVQVNPTSVEAYRTIKDARMIDPVCCENTRTNSGDAAYVLTVADFEGRQLLGYRLGEAKIGKKIFKIRGKNELEFMGSNTYPGRVYLFNADNVP